MIVVFGVIDRILDIIGLFTVVYLAVKATLWFNTKGKSNGNENGSGTGTTDDRFFGLWKRH